MTKEEVIKALRCCAVNQSCYGCPMYADGSASCLRDLCAAAADLLDEKGEDNATD